MNIDKIIEKVKDIKSIIVLLIGLILVPIIQDIANTYYRNEEYYLLIVLIIISITFFWFLYRLPDFFDYLANKFSTYFKYSSYKNPLNKKLNSIEKEILAIIVHSPTSNITMKDLSAKFSDVCKIKMYKKSIQKLENCLFIYPKNKKYFVTGNGTEYCHIHRL